MYWRDCVDCSRLTLK